MDNKSPELKNFFESQLPSIVRNLQRIADCQEMTVGKPRRVESEYDPFAEGLDYPSGVYVCYEENSASLYSEAGNINHLFVTEDISLAREWAEKSFVEAKKNGFLPIEDSDKEEFFDTIGSDPYDTLWVYRGKNNNGRDNYGICVNFFDPAKSKELLNSMFS